MRTLNEKMNPSAFFCAPERTHKHCSSWFDCAKMSSHLDLMPQWTGISLSLFHCSSRIWGLINHFDFRVSRSFSLRSWQACGHLRRYWSQKLTYDLRPVLVTNCLLSADVWPIAWASSSFSLCIQRIPFSYLLDLHSNERQDSQQLTTILTQFTFPPFSASFDRWAQSSGTYLIFHPKISQNKNLWSRPQELKALQAHLSAFQFLNPLENRRC